MSHFLRRVEDAKKKHAAAETGKADAEKRLVSEARRVIQKLEAEIAPLRAQKGVVIRTNDEVNEVTSESYSPWPPTPSLAVLELEVPTKRTFGVSHEWVVIRFRVESNEDGIFDADEDGLVFYVADFVAKAGMKNKREFAGDSVGPTAGDIYFSYDEALTALAEIVAALDMYCEK